MVTALLFGISMQLQNAFTGNSNSPIPINEALVKETHVEVKEANVESNMKEPEVIGYLFSKFMDAKNHEDANCQVIYADKIINILYSNPNYRDWLKRNNPGRLSSLLSLRFTISINETNLEANMTEPEVMGFLLSKFMDAKIREDNNCQAFYAEKIINTMRSNPNYRDCLKGNDLVKSITAYHKVIESQQKSITLVNETNVEAKMEEPEVIGYLLSQFTDAKNCGDVNSQVLYADKIISVLNSSLISNYKDWLKRNNPGRLSLLVSLRYTISYPRIIEYQQPNYIIPVFPYGYQGYQGYRGYFGYSGRIIFTGRTIGSMHGGYQNVFRGRR